jgi:hypothetical protein
MPDDYVPIVIAAALAGTLLLAFFTYAAYRAARIGK